MIAKKVTYEMRMGMYEPFFLKSPEACAGAKALVIAHGGPNKQPDAESHAAIWTHVEGCAVCMRNIIRMLGDTFGGVPLPIFNEVESLAGPIRWEAGKRESN